MYNISNDEKYFDEAFLKIPGLVGRATEQPEFLVHSDGGAPHFEVIIVTNSETGKHILALINTNSSLCLPS